MFRKGIDVVWPVCASLLLPNSRKVKILCDAVAQLLHAPPCALWSFAGGGSSFVPLGCSICGALGLVGYHMHGGHDSGSYSHQANFPPCHSIPQGQGSLSLSQTSQQAAPSLEARSLLDVPHLQHAVVPSEKYFLSTNYFFSYIFSLSFHPWRYLPVG